MDRRRERGGKDGGKERGGKDGGRCKEEGRREEGRRREGERRKGGGRELVDYKIKDKGNTVKEVITITEPFIIHQLVLFAIQYSKFIVGY